MRTLARLWAAATGVAVATGLLLCFALVPLGLWVVVGVVAGTIASATRTTLVNASPRLGATVPNRGDVVAVASTATLAVVGWGAFMPVLAGLVVLVLAVTALPLVLWSWPLAAPTGPVSSSRQQPTSAPPTTRVDAGPPAAVASWSDDELCRAWRASYTRLGWGDLHLLASVARERGLYLDEIERRHPREFRRWMGAHPRAASDPRRFLPAACPLHTRADDVPR